MAADPIIYCLEQLTDYRQFERFSNDLMRLEGYCDLEPLGGTADKGRDAINVCKHAPDDVTIFAYSVREDWRAKLKQDVKKVIEHGHQFKTIVFLCTAHVSATERDDVIEQMKTEHGADIKLFALERIRSLVATTHSSLIGKHPAIFTPDFFPHAGGVTLCDTPDYVIIDFDDSDAALANWLGERLILAGYQVWWKTRAPIAGSSLSNCIESLISNRGHRVLQLLSESALNDPELTARRTLAAITRGGIIIPIQARPFDDTKLDKKTREIELVRFDDSWAEGLRMLLVVLEAAGTPRFTDGRSALSSVNFRASDVVSDEAEIVTSNRFRVTQLPKSVRRFDAKIELDRDTHNSLVHSWPSRFVSATRFLSFDEPPENIKKEYGIVEKGAVLADPSESIEKISMRQILPDLLKKTLHAHAIARGLKWCPTTRLIYFPAKLLKSERLPVVKMDGSKTVVHTNGQKKFWRPGVAMPYRYQLAPAFFVQTGPDGAFTIVCRMRVRLTDLSDEVLPPRTRNSRRKHLCKSWWNTHWLHRILGTMQYLSDDGSIKIGPLSNQQLIISATPDHWSVAPSINEAALKDADDLRELIASYNDEDDIDEVESDA